MGTPLPVCRGRLVARHPFARCEASLSGSSHSDQGAFRILEMAHNEPNG
jgi:hypothetical protein